MSCSLPLPISAITGENSKNASHILSPNFIQPFYKKKRSLNLDRPPNSSIMPEDS